MTKAAYVEWPDGLIIGSPEWQSIENQIDGSDMDILVTNEMPFGAWRPINSDFILSDAQSWADENEAALDALAKLNVKAVISSRPIVQQGKLVNEAFALENGNYTILHHKHFFPAEQGWHEAAWFHPTMPGFDVHEVAGVKVGVQLCTELMFTEKSRQYGRDGADLIVSPRASGQTTVEWNAACAMAAVTSGAYVISSNRVGQSSEAAPFFGGKGLSYAPGGPKLGETNSENTLAIIELDKKLADAVKLEYPCYLRY
ncbi:MAG: carbon-nitrogen hydrolase family protein [Emcibacteraceae bacterium]|nr:carbon-nitrogen hydrolase family protein [Emcibacteraceae bacterium]MDG1995602.1 carbon-nitrogen hydrolase family protein [Emcibacteraceae bacterium]